MKVNRKFIAEKAGVSTTTVSYVINNTPSARISESVRKRVMQVARQYNYIPDASARALVTGKTCNIGFIYKSSIMDFFSDPFTHEVFTGLEQELEKNDYSLMFALLKKFQGEELSNSATRMLSGRFVDGVILYGDIGIEIIKKLKQARIPFILIDYLFDDAPCNSILPDNRRGAKIAVNYLLEQGCERICCLNGDLEEFQHPAYVERPGGYADAMEKAGRELDIVSTRPDIDSSYNTVTSLLKKGKCPDAFFATGDHIAIGCLNAVKDFDSKLLKNLRIIGFDDIAWDETVQPALSTVRVPKFDLGAEAVRMLLSDVDAGTTGTRTVRLDTELIIRET